MTREVGGLGERDLVPFLKTEYNSRDLYSKGINLNIVCRSPTFPDILLYVHPLLCILLPLPLPEIYLEDQRDLKVYTTYHFF